MTQQEPNWDRLDVARAQQMTEFVRLLNLKVMTILMTIGCGSAFVVGRLVSTQTGFMIGLVGYFIALPIGQLLWAYPATKKAFDEAERRTEDEYIKVKAIIAANKAAEEEAKPLD